MRSAGERRYVSDPASEHGRPDWFWTGTPPSKGTPGVLNDGSMTSLKLPDLNTATKREILEYFDNTWCLTEVLFSALQGARSGADVTLHVARHARSRPRQNVRFWNVDGLFEMHLFFFFFLAWEGFGKAGNAPLGCCAWLFVSCRGP